MQSIKKKRWLFLLLTIATCYSYARTETSLDIYLLIGQSNMAGRGIITEQYAVEGDPRVLMLNQENKWVPAKHPLHFDKPSVAGVGPGLSFGMEMAKANPSRKIGLVPCAVGGSPIDMWKEGALYTSTNTRPYDDMVLRIREAMKSGSVKGIIWLQGESDAKPGLVDAYLPKLKALVEKLRVLLNEPALPFVAGELGRFREEYNGINTELDKLPAQVPYTRTVTSEGLAHKGDRTHFDAPSAELYGLRFAEQMKLLQKEGSKK